MIRDYLVIILFVVLGVMPGYTYGQLSSNADSLKTLLQESTGEQRVEVLLELSNQLYRSDVDSAADYAREALMVSQRMEHRSLQADSHRNLGRLLSVGGDHPEGLQHLLKAKDLYEQAGMLKEESAVLVNIGALYKRQSDYQKSLEYYFSALNLREQLNDQRLIARTLLNIGMVYEQLDQPEQSIDFYERALAVSEERNAASATAIVASALGEAYASIGKTEKGVEAMKTALAASENLPGEHARASILLSISSLYKDQKSYQQALESNQEALALAERMKSKALQTLAQQNIASIYIDQNDYETAEDYLLQAVRALEEGGSQEQVIETRNRLARNYLAMGSYSESIGHGQQAYEAAAKASAFEPGIESLQILTDAYEQTGDYQKAVAAREKMMAFKDSIFDAEQARQIAEMQTRYETEQKEQEIALLRADQEKANLLRNALIGGLILLVIIGILIYNRQRIKIKKNRTDLENTRLKEQQLAKDLEFKNKQLTTHSLHLVQKNEAMKELKKNISEINKKENGEIAKELQGLKNLVDYSFNLDEDWEQFRLYFEEVHSGFFDILKERYPDLTSNELRLSALVKLNLTSKEIAAIMGITSDSVKTARYRLRKKLDMETEENLTTFMMDMEKEASES